LAQSRRTETVQESRRRVISVSLFVLLLEFNPSPLKRNSDLGGKASDEICNMSKPVVEVQVRAVAAVSGGCAVFLGNEDKVFVMFVDQSVGAAITMFMQGTQKERPLTHDLANVLRALGAKIDRVVVNELKDGTYFARLVLSAENEMQQKKIIEIDARPSDCIAMATQQSAPIFVSLEVWDEVEDMTEVLRKMQQEGSDTEQSDEEE
jgi:uncharacterized protein